MRKSDGNFDRHFENFDTILDAIFAFGITAGVVGLFVWVAIMLLCFFS